MALTLLLLATATPAQAGKGGKKPEKLPDLVPKAAQLEGNPYALIGRRPTSSVKLATGNRGEKRAGPSLTTVYLEHGNIRGDVGDRAVPGLKPGDNDTGHADFTDRVDVLDPGKYRVRACVDTNKDVKESNEKNNCGRVQGAYYVSRQTWSGSLSGVFPEGDGDVSERWSSSDASLVFDEYLHAGIFTYLLQGTVFWQVTGTGSGGCTFTGSGLYTFSPSIEHGQLTLNLEKGEYAAVIAAPDDFEYPQQITCGQDTSPGVPGPRSPAVLRTVEGNKPFPFGTSTIAGNSTVPFIGENFVWDFR